MASNETTETKAESGSKNDAIFNALDNTKFSWFHTKAIVISGIGFFTDAFDLFIINMIVPMIGIAYFNGKVPVLEETLMKGASVVGTFIGQIVFGIIADRYGRKKMYGIELMLMILGTIGTCLASSMVRGLGVAALVTFWRFIIGIGIGGDYPLSAVITSEYANVSRRGQMMAAVFAMQGFGILFGSIVSLFFLACFKNMIEQDPLNADYVWRLCVGAGCIPAAAALYFRLTLPETPRFTAHVEGDRAKVAEDIQKIGVAQTNSSEPVSAEINEPEVTRASWSDFRQYFSKWENLRILLGCASTWFFLDVAFYGLGLNQSIVLKTIGYVRPNGTPYETLYDLAAGNAIISLMGTVPGYWLTVLLIEKLGRIKIQLLGFAVLTVVFVVLAAAYTQILNQALWLFIMLYCIGLFFFNFGPNTTTFIIPGEVFPTRYRSTGHGISAASGKLGAILATYAFTPIAKSGPRGVQTVLAIFSVFMLAGLICTFLLKETRGLSLEQLANEQQTPSDEAKKRDSKYEFSA